MPDLLEQSIHPDTSGAPIEPQQEFSIAEHAAEFGPQGVPVEERTVEVPAPLPAPSQGKHRAQSQRATPEDVEQINALTKELRTKEAELLKTKPEAVSGSPRLIALRRQIKAIESELSDLQPTPPKDAPAPRRVAPVAHPGAKPNWAAFEEKIGSTYDSWGAAQDAYNDARDSWREVQVQHTQQGREQQDMVTKAITTHFQRVQHYQQAHVDQAAQLAAFSDRDLPPLMLNAIVRDDNGPDFMYYLETHPDLFDELMLQTVGKEPTDALVATLQRRLRTLSAQAVSTGSAAGAVQYSLAPRPPNPVRTGPMKTGDDPPAEGSVSAHLKAYGPKAKR